VLRVRCPGAASMRRLAPSEIVVGVAPGGGGSRFSFACLLRVMVVTRMADRRTIVLLHAAGVELEDGGDGYPGGRPGGPPSSRDDLLSFHQLLDRGDVFRQLDAPSDGMGGGR
jgi:hypothetical protein